MIWDCRLVPLSSGEIISVQKRRKFISLYSRMPSGSSLLIWIKAQSSIVSSLYFPFIPSLINVLPQTTPTSLACKYLASFIIAVIWWCYKRLTRMRQMACHPDLVLRSKTNATQFVQDASEATVCRLCNDVAEDAIQSKCRHIFDRECIKQYLESTFEINVSFFFFFFFLC